MNCFLANNSPLDAAIRLEEAPFWTNSQAELLHEKIQLDADWAVVVDQLNLALREPIRIPQVSYGALQNPRYSRIL